MDDVTRLVEVQQLLGLKARYFRYVDTKQWDRLETVFAPDAEMAVPSASFAVEGRQAIVATIRETLEGAVTVHHGHMPEIEVLDAEHAKGIWAMEDLLIYSSGGPTATVRGYGHYVEEYVKDDGAWCIRRLHLSRLHRERTSYGRDAHPTVEGP